MADSGFTHLFVVKSNTRRLSLVEQAAEVGNLLKSQVTYFLQLVGSLYFTPEYDKTKEFASNVTIVSIMDTSSVHPKRIVDGFS